MSLTDKVLAACELRPGPWPTEPGCCAWCGAKLTGRQRRWCAGGECESEFTRQHNWQAARAAAIKRDGGVCTTCGADPGTPELLAWWSFVQAVTLISLYMGVESLAVWAAAEGLDLERDRQATWNAWRDEMDRRALPFRSAHRIVQDARQAVQLEVNHITPIMGRHAEFGCHHHLEGLETLCHRCHVQETARQFGYRTATPDPQLSLLDGAA